MNQQGEQRSETERNGEQRNIAEWVSFAVASLLVAVVVGLVLFTWANSEQSEARFEISADQPRHEDGYYYLPVTVSNLGDETAAEVELEGVIGSGPSAERISTVFTFVPGNSEEQATLIFQQPPDDVQLRIVSYQEP